MEAAGAETPGSIPEKAAADGAPASRDAGVADVIPSSRTCFAGADKCPLGTGAKGASTVAALCTLDESVTSMESFATLGREGGGATSRTLERGVGTTFTSVAGRASTSNRASSAVVASDHEPGVVGA